MGDSERETARSRRRETFGLAVLFGALYFIQGIGEPTEGLIAQPVRSLLAFWGHSASEIAAFSALLSIPWVLKPLYGLLSDFVPIAGSHRRNYLLVTSAAATLGFAYLSVDPTAAGSTQWLLVLLLVPTVAVAFSDVVADALMVEKGQPRGITGQLQSVQWAAMYAATVATGVVGGYLSQHGQQALGFLICAVFTAGTGILALLHVRDEPRAPSARGRSGAWAALRNTLRSPPVWAVAVFIFLWNFNPFSTAVLYIHMTRSMGLSEQFYGNTVSVQAVAAVVASIAYYFYCRRVRLGRLIHLSIAAGVASTLAYWGLSGPVSAMGVTVLVGLTYMTGMLIQLDLAARACPLETAGTTFALLMAVSNLGYSASVAVGGYLYDGWLATRGEFGAFDTLVGIGALSTCACWVVVPWLRRQIEVQAATK